MFIRKYTLVSLLAILSSLTANTNSEENEVNKNRTGPGSLECGPNGSGPCKQQQPHNPTDSDSTPKKGSISPNSQPFPYALSATYLTYLARAELDIYNEMSNYAKALEERLDLLRNYLKDYEDSTGKGTTHVPEDADSWHRASQAAAHPLIAYRLVRRFAYEFQATAQHIGQNLEKRMEDVVTKLAGQYGWPTKRDAEDAMEAMLRLHYIYDLDLDEFTKGNLLGVKTNVELTTRQVFQIGEFAIRNEYYSLSRDWLKLTEARMKTDPESGVSAFAVANAYKRLKDFHDQNYGINKDENHLYIFDKPLNATPVNDVSTVRETAMKTLPGTEEPTVEVTEDENGNEVEVESEETETVEDPRKFEADHYTFLGLCNGENYQTEKYKSQLKCWYETSRSGYFSHINPLKFELLHKDPMLLQIYDVIGDKWISKLIKKAMPTLQRAPLPTGPSVTYRTASYAWLPDEQLLDTPISRRIELITNLNVRGSLASEALQIASYAYGGHVAAHFDSLGLNPNETKLAVMGDRVTTFLIYLNNVQRGGYTAFPLLKTHVKPVKGSAVLWYTAMKNGDIDTRMLHGACPVILGHKWIATKWTNLNQNFLKRPCDINPNV